MQKTPSEYARDWERRNPERAREIKRAARARYNARKLLESGRFPLRVRRVQRRSVPHNLDQQHTRFCPGCVAVRPMVEFPYEGEVCFACTTERTCRTCGETKPVERFPRRREGRGWRSFCWDCLGARNREREKIKRTAIYEREGGRCHICRLPVGDDFHVEHLFPRAAGGSDDMSNLAIAHPVCNMRKAAKVLPVQLRMG